MAKIGYARVSTTEQADALQQQVDKLHAAGCEPVRTEEISGPVPYEKRPVLNNLLDFVRKGDTLVIVRVDRLARSVHELQKLAILLKQKGAYLEATDQPIDTSTASGKAFFDMLGVFAEFETELRKERQIAGIQRARSEGKYKGRKKALTTAQVKELKDRAAKGEPKVFLAQHYGISRQTLYQYLQA